MVDVKKRKEAPNSVRIYGLLSIAVTSVLVFLVLVYPRMLNSSSNQESKRRNAIPHISPQNIKEETISYNSTSINVAIFEKVVSKNLGKNIVISPLSIFAVLAMTSLGARGPTLEEMITVIFPGMKSMTSSGDKNFQDIQNALPLIRKLGNNLKSITSTDYANTAIRVANGIWMNKGRHIDDTFEEQAKLWFQAEMDTLDFRNNKEHTVQVINSWVEKHTNNLIKDLISAESVSDLTVSILVNAIYFKGIWKYSFSKSSTYNHKFRLFDGSYRDVTMMSKVFKNYPDVMCGKHSTVNGLPIKFTSLTLPYKDTDFRMMFLLPEEEGAKHMDELVRALFSKGDGSTIREVIQQQTGSKSINALIPRFKIESQMELGGYIKDLGMESPFTTGLSKICSNSNVIISDVIHKAYIEVNEEGTEAAAATAILLLESVIIEPEPFVFRLDRPFISILFHQPTNQILFASMIQSP